MIKISACVGFAGVYGVTTTLSVCLRLVGGLRRCDKAFRLFMFFGGLRRYDNTLRLFGFWGGFRAL